MKIIQRNLINPATITRSYFIDNLLLKFESSHYACKFILKINQLLDAIVLNCSYEFRKSLIQFSESVPIQNLRPN